MFRLTSNPLSNSFCETTNCKHSQTKIGNRVMNASKHKKTVTFLKKSQLSNFKEKN